VEFFRYYGDGVDGALITVTRPNLPIMVIPVVDPHFPIWLGALTAGYSLKQAESNFVDLPF
jgi:hypothetical protein